MEGVEALSDPEVIRMRQEAGVDTDSQEVINAVSYHIFQIKEGLIGWIILKFER